MQSPHWASSVPTLYAFSLTKRSCHVLFVARVAVDFPILRSHFWYRQTVPKNATVKVLSFFEVCRINVAEAQPFFFNEALWLMATGRATREALLSEAGFEKVFRTENWVRRRKLFCR